MKCEIETHNGNLVLSFKKRDLKNDEDKQVICTLISLMYEYHCVEFIPDVNYLDNLLVSTLGEIVSLTIMPLNNKVQLVQFL